MKYTTGFGKEELHRVFIGNRRNCHIEMACKHSLFGRGKRSFYHAHEGDCKVSWIGITLGPGQNIEAGSNTRQIPCLVHCEIVIRRLKHGTSPMPFDIEPPSLVFPHITYMVTIGNTT